MIDNKGIIVHCSPNISKEKLYIINIIGTITIKEIINNFLKVERKFFFTEEKSLFVSAIYT
ncbi:hypothetical protein VPR01S_04_01900 [Vibrio proteolyticus NBRC 13287]|uniref:Uncharacterized protein n=1 Tax=Vibrio proteolyticus NBRC 13287 TaxID=1219065 RepID=U2ZYR8_VIBPR|nr:hypothetical protein VPR01S_04_01900 [Vibrio proteolyticus NBRC 13287]